jgi:lipopolysaccharide transport system ATP-binding protein
MSQTVIKVEDLGKLYKLGEIGTGTISHDLNRWLARVRGKEDPFAKIGETNDRTARGASDYVWALKDVNFEVKQGEVLGIIGRNGAGKSTLLKILSKVTAPSTGQIRIRGRIASLLEVGTGFHPELTGRENIFLNGAILGMTKHEILKKFDEIVDFAGVERYIDTPVKRYSSGMYVRLAFAVAAFLEPEILIIDEVLAVGDAEFQKKCMGRMKDVSVNDGRTVLFVSHSMASVRNLCQKGLLLSQGKVSTYGTIESVIKAYLENKETSRKSYFKQEGHKNTNHVKEVFLTSSKGEKISVIEAGTSDVYINFIIDVKYTSGLNLGFTLFNSEGIAVISSPPLSDQLQLVEGLNICIIKIPVEILKAGEYVVEGALWSHAGLHESNDSFISFTVETKSKLEITGAGIRGLLINPNSWSARIV